MNEIVLKRANVVKRVDSEERAKALEAKGFVRADGKTVQKAASGSEVEELKSQLIKAGEVIKTADERRKELEKELSDTTAKLEESSKKIEDLTQELAGTREQLEAAVKKNKAAEKK